MSGCLNCRWHYQPLGWKQGMSQVEHLQRNSAHLGSILQVLLGILTARLLEQVIIGCNWHSYSCTAVCLQQWYGVLFFSTLITSERCLCVSLASWSPGSHFTSGPNGFFAPTGNDFAKVRLDVSIKMIIKTKLLHWPVHFPVSAGLVLHIFLCLVSSSFEWQKTQDFKRSQSWTIDWLQPLSIFIDFPGRWYEIYSPVCS